MSATHYIQRQRFQIRVSNREDTAFVHETVGEIVDDKLLPRLELLNCIVGPDETIQIDRLHLNLGELSREGFADQLVDAVIDALSRELESLNVPQ